MEKHQPNLQKPTNSKVKDFLTFNIIQGSFKKAVSYNFTTSFFNQMTYNENRERLRCGVAN